MTSTQQKALRNLKRSIEERVPQLENKLRKAGIEPDRAVVLSIAEHYEALDKLAKE